MYHAQFSLQSPGGEHADVHDAAPTSWWRCQIVVGGALVQIPGRVTNRQGEPMDAHKSPSWTRPNAVTSPADGAD